MGKEAIDRDLGQRLSRFFDLVRASLERGTCEEASGSPIDRERFFGFIKRLREPLSAAEAQICTNPWLTAGLGHDEVRVSAALASLWDHRRHGDEGRAFLRRFLAFAGEEVPGEAELANGYRVQTEHCLNGSAADRVDITVETSSFLVGIELKIRAKEGENQLPRYIAAIEARARLMLRAHHKVIFLSPYAPKAMANEVASVTWKAVAEAAVQADQSTHAGWLIRQFGEYCRSLGR